MRNGTVAIMPPGALGVGLFYYLTDRLRRNDGDVYFVGLDRSRSIAALLAGGLRIVHDGVTRHLPADGLIFPTLDHVWSLGRRPEILIVCPNPDQQFEVVGSLVALIERVWAENPDDAEPHIPAIILSANGIYFQRVRQFFIEKLEESTLMGRLPDLWPDHMPRIVGHLLRGVTFQTAVRQGHGAEASYHPGPRGISVLAGGSETVRRRCVSRLAELGAWFDHAPGISPTRLEIEKAIANLAGNLLGMIYAFDDDGRFTPLTVADILRPEHADEILLLTTRVVEVGRAVKAYTSADDPALIVTQVRARMQAVASHTPSSLQAIAFQIRSGTLKVEFPPTETWLIDPLLRYARSANLTQCVEYFEGLRTALLAKLTAAVARREE